MVPVFKAFNNTEVKNNSNCGNENEHQSFLVFVLQPQRETSFCAESACVGVTSESSRLAWKHVAEKLVYGKSAGGLCRGSVLSELDVSHGQRAIQ